MRPDGVTKLAWAKLLYGHKPNEWGCRPDEYEILYQILSFAQWHLLPSVEFEQYPRGEQSEKTALY